MRAKRNFAVIKNIGKARDPRNEVALFIMNFPKEFMNLTPCRQPVANARILKAKWIPHIWPVSMLKCSMLLIEHLSMIKITIY